MSIKNRLSIGSLPGQLLKIVLLPCILIAACNITMAYANDSKTIKLDSIILNGLQSGQYVILLRHALAPGFSDPEIFDVNDCSTQRNLSDQGRQQAQRIGKLLKTNGIQQAVVYSSQWCRCLETARLLDLGEVTELPIINSFFQRTELKDQRTQGLRQWLIDNKPINSNNKQIAPTILVTHQVNITALTDVFPSSGELVIVNVDGLGSVSVVTQLETGH